MAELRSIEWVGGNFSNIDIEGISYIHHDIDHNPTASDMPFKYCNIIYSQTKIFGTKNIVAIAISHEQKIKIGGAWTGEMLWKEL